MEVFKKGLPLRVEWHLVKPDGSEFSVSGLQFILRYGNSRGRTLASGVSAHLEYSSVDESIMETAYLTWTFTAEMQHFVGQYDLELIVLNNGKEIAKLFRKPAFVLSNNVSNPVLVDGNQELVIESTVDFYKFNPIIPVVDGEHGYWVVNGEPILNDNGDYIYADHTMRYDPQTQYIIIDEGRVDAQGQSIQQTIEVLAVVKENYDADHTRAGEDHTTAVNDHDSAVADHSRAGEDHARANNDHNQAVSDSTRASTDHSTAVGDHDTASSDHTRAVSDHNTASNDHSRAASDHSTATADHTQAGNDHNTAASDHTRANTDHGQSVDDHNTATSDSTRASNDHDRANTDHTAAVNDHTRAENDHTRAEGDHETAASDHTTAVNDHTTAGSDHTTAGNDHTQAGSDHTRAGEDHTQAGTDHTAAVTATSAANDAAELANTKAGVAQTAADNADAARAAIQEDLARKANIDGYYQTLTAGAAENLVGDPIAVTSGYTEKPLAIGPNGEVNEVADGRIVMNEVRGRTIAWNQLFANTVSQITITDGTISKNGKYTLNLTSSPVADYVVLLNTSSIISGHKYLWSCSDSRFNINNSWVCGTDVSYYTQSKLINSTSYSGTARLGLLIPQGLPIGTYEFGVSLVDLTQTFGPGNEPSTVAQAEAMLSSRRRMKPYFPYNAGTLLGARLLGWSMPRTANLLNPTTKKARLVAYTNPGNTNNQYTVTNFDQLMGAALQFTPDETGVAEAVTLDADNHFVISGPGTLEIVASGQDQIGGNVAQVCVKMTWDGSKDDLVVAFEEYETNPDSAKIYYDDNGTKKQVFENGIMKAASASVFEKLYFDSVSKKWGANLPVGSVDLGTLTYEMNGARFNTLVPGMKYAASGWSADTLAISTKFVWANAVNTDSEPGLMGCNTYNIYFSYNAESAEQFKAAMSGVPLWYELATPVTLNDLYYKVGNDYVPMEEVFPDGFIGYGCNWATETLVEQDPDANGQPTSITPETVENFTTDLKEAIKTLIDAQEDNVDLTLLRSNLVAMCEAMKQGGVVADYTISENATGGVFAYSFTPNA